MFKKLRQKIESKRGSKSLFWKILVLLKDFLWNILYFFDKKFIRYSNFSHFNILLSNSKAIYFFIPKVACSSLKNVCISLLNREKEFSIYKKNGNGIHRFDLPSISKRKISEYQDYFKFAFVRNPWDRLVSFYEDKVNKKIQNLFNNKYREIFSSEMSFSDFVKAVASINDLVANRHFKSQYLFLTDKKQNLIVDFIGRFENLEKDFDFVLNKLNIKKNIELPHFNKTKHKHYSEYYTEETRKLVEKRYRKDIKMFGYKFEKKNV